MYRSFRYTQNIHPGNGQLLCTEKRERERERDGTSQVCSTIHQEYLLSNFSASILIAARLMRKRAREHEGIVVVVAVANAVVIAVLTLNSFRQFLSYLKCGLFGVVDTVVAAAAVVVVAVVVDSFKINFQE